MEMNSMWQPSARTPWPDRVNEELSRHGAGLEDHERQIETLVIRPEEHIRIIYGLEDHERQIKILTERVNEVEKDFSWEIPFIHSRLKEHEERTFQLLERIQSLERIVTQLCKEIHQVKSGGE